MHYLLQLLILRACAANLKLVYASHTFRRLPFAVSINLSQVQIKRFGFLREILATLYPNALRRGSVLRTLCAQRQDLK